MLKAISRVLTKNHANSFRRTFSKMESKNLVWIDMEMTGLQVEKCKVLQIGALVTDSKLNVISPDFCTAIHQKDEILNNMDEWCTKNLKEVAINSRNSSVTEEKAEQLLLDYLSQYVDPKTAPLAGNSVYMDRLFLRKYFPKVNEYLHYRLVDVSSVKELCKRWNPSVWKNTPWKEHKHSALDDIKESIAELKYYKEKLFISEE